MFYHFIFGKTMVKHLVKHLRQIPPFSPISAITIILKKSSESSINKGVSQYLSRYPLNLQVIRLGLLQIRGFFVFMGFFLI